MDHYLFLQLLVFAGVSLAANVDVSMFLKPSTLVPNVQPLPSNAVQSCYVDGKDGECVPTYLCDDDNQIITDGNGLLDERNADIHFQTLEPPFRIAKGGKHQPFTPKHFTSVLEDIFKTFTERWTQHGFVTIDKRLSDLRFAEDSVLYALNNASSGFGAECSNIVEVCCLPATKRDEENPITIAPPPKREGCGWHNPEGVGMKTIKLEGETNFGEYPWMVGLLFNNGTKIDFLGGASLIHPNVVLTAGHLANKVKDKLSQIIVRAGEWDTQTEAEIYRHQDRKVASVEIHKDFNRGNLFYDIALIFLQEPFDLTQPHINVVCLPPQTNAATDPGTRCTATGWGKDKFGKKGVFHVALKKVELPVVEFFECRDLLRKTRLGGRFELHTSFMCAGGEPGIDTCTGDGGSPLSCPIEDDPGRLMQSGIVAWGIGCGDNNTPGVYVNVGRLRKWIDDKVAGKGYDPRVYTI